MSIYTEKEIFNEVHSGPLGAQILSDGAYIIESEGWFQLVSPNRLEASRNEVIVSAISVEKAEQKIDETIAFYRKLGTSFKWVVDPKTQPDGFAELLRKKGFRSWFGRGMYCHLSDIQVEFSEDIEVEKVSIANVENYVDLSIEGWDMDKKLRSSLIEDYSWALKQSDERFNFYIAKAGGVPAGTAGFITKKRSGYLIGGNVLEKFQGKGVYKALIKKRLDDISGLNIQLATSGTREKTSAPILERLGFKTVYRDEIFQYDFQ